MMFEAKASAKLRDHINDIRNAPPDVRVNMECVYDFIARHETGCIFIGKHKCWVSLDLSFHSKLYGMSCGSQFSVGDYCLVCLEKLLRIPDENRYWYLNHAMGPFRG